VAEYIDRVAEAAKGDEPAARQIGIGAAVQLHDAIGYNLFYVLDWVTRRRGVETANALKAEADAILSAMYKPQERTPDGALILDLFTAARLFAWRLRNWANDIELEETWRLSPEISEGRPGRGSGDRAENGRRQRMSVDRANEKAQRLAMKMRMAFFALSERQQAELIGCSWKTWTKTPFYKKAKEKRPAGLGRKPASPKTASLTPKVEATTGEGDRDEVLQQLIEEQEADREPSPLESDPPNRPRQVHFRKRL
jgi:hypothetical protein